MDIFGMIKKLGEGVGQAVATGASQAGRAVGVKPAGKSVGATSAGRSVGATSEGRSAGVRPVGSSAGVLPVGGYATPPNQPMGQFLMPQVQEDDGLVFGPQGLEPLSSINPGQPWTTEGLNSSLPIYTRRRR